MPLSLINISFKLIERKREMEVYGENAKTEMTMVARLEEWKGCWLLNPKAKSRRRRGRKRVMR